MTCDDARALLDAYFDSELDVTASLQVEQHLGECNRCSADLRNLERLREELSPAVFNRLDGPELDRLKQSVRKRAGLRSVWRPHPALWAAVAAGLVLAVVLPLRNTNSVGGFERELVDNHVRSLMADHLVDVPSSDQHTVKPWFQGKIDFAPDVRDLGEKGFTLIGGRLDFLAGRPTAAIVYKRRSHFINLWISRAASGDEGVAYSTADGYQVAHWTSGGLSRWAVTDMNRADLGTFVELIRAR